ncbi:lipoprotein [Streptomyces sp. NPDC101490]|uniref:lipoprotein n=1 Tax=Streptomyces sp. NPDC101490 TaxID=3366143 RepID=UPI00382603D0
MTPPTRTVPVLAALLAGALLTGCGGPEPVAGATPGPRPTSAPAVTPSGASAVASAVARVGADGSACPLPVSFGIAAGWKPRAVEAPKDPDFAELLRQGPAELVCEIDAKPAGNIGFLRVWTVRGGAARAALEGFVKAGEKASAIVHRKTVAGTGSVPAAEVTYTVLDGLTEEDKEERAFAVAAPGGTVIVHLGGFDTAEHRAMLPAYELARTSLRTAP